MLNASPRFIGALTELVWVQIELASRDVEAFARQAAKSSLCPCRRAADWPQACQKDHHHQGGCLVARKTQRESGADASITLLSLALCHQPYLLQHGLGPHTTARHSILAPARTNRLLGQSSGAPGKSGKPAATT